MRPKPEPIVRSTFHCTLVRERLDACPDGNSVKVMEMRQATVILSEPERTTVYATYPESIHEAVWAQRDTFAGPVGDSYTTYGDWRIAEAVPDDQETTSTPRT